jgi:membrane protein DedA with SNARE-associated domain
MDPVSFMIASIFGRALHFAMVGTLLMLFGGRILTLVARYEKPFAVISILVLVGLVVAFHLS